MIVVCAWCKRVLVDDNDGSRVMSHGICQDCKKTMLADLEEVAMTAKTFDYVLDVVGLKFRMNLSIRQELAKRCPLSGIKLVREQENRYDINAIRVEYPPGHSDAKKKHIGYVRADSAAILAPLMDEGKLVFKNAKLAELVDGNSGPLSEGRMFVVFNDKR